MGYFWRDLGLKRFNEKPRLLVQAELQLFFKLLAVYTCFVGPVFEVVPVSVPVAYIYGPVSGTWVGKANDEPVVRGLVNRKAVVPEGKRMMSQSSEVW